MKRKDKPNFKELPRPNMAVPADPTQWSKKSQQTVSAMFIKEYKDIEYDCFKCRTVAMFTALQQKHTYEVKQAHIDQRRNLCAACHDESNRILDEIAVCEAQWAESKDLLRRDTPFLLTWLHLLEERELYVRNRENTAAKAMLKKLLNMIAI